MTDSQNSLALNKTARGVETRFGGGYIVDLKDVVIGDLFSWFRHRYRMDRVR